MELGLRGRKALITGASKGIGRACAEVLAEEGCDVVLVSRTAADLEAARAAIVAKHNVAVRFYPLDLSDSRNVDKLAAECAETDLLVNNAASISGIVLVVTRRIIAKIVQSMHTTTLCNRKREHAAGQNCEIPSLLQHNLPQSCEAAVAPHFGM